jgi:hypothetical protein
MQSTLRTPSPAAAYRSRNSVVSTRLPRPRSTVMRRFKGADSPAQAVEAPAAEAPAGAQEDAAPAKAKFNHAYLIFNPAAGQENPVSVADNARLADLARQLQRICRAHVQVQAPKPSCPLHFNALHRASRATNVMHQVPKTGLSLAGAASVQSTRSRRCCACACPCSCIGVCAFCRPASLVTSASS